MERRTGLLIAAVTIAALGTLLVFLYVRGADNRADERYDAVRVLRAVKQIEPGETVAAAQAAGKIQIGSIGRAQLLPGALTGLDPIEGQVAITTIYPGEQIIPAKFGGSASGATLAIPKGKMAVSVNLTDPARVAGFINPGDRVSVFMQSPGLGTGGPFARLLLPEVEVIGVGTTTVVPTTTTDQSGAQTAEQSPRTLITLALDQTEAEKVLFATGNGEVALGLLDENSEVGQGRGVSGQNLFR